MRLVWVVIPLVLFGFIGMQESFAEERTWYVGEGLKQGDYFSYKLCHADYNDCSEFQMDLWIEGDVQRGSETHWLTQTVVYDNNKVVKGVMHLGKVASEPTYSSHEIAFYKSAFKASITELAVFSSILHPGSLTLGDYWYKNMKFIPIGQTPINVNATENEKITVPAGTYDTVVLSYSNSQDRIWIVDDFPFPIKGEAWEPGNEPKSKRYQFKLLDYKENVLEDPFVAITPFEESFAEESNNENIAVKNCGNLGPIYLYSSDGKPILGYCLFDIWNATFSTSPVYEQNGNFSIPGYNFTDPYPKINSLLEHQLEGLIKLLTQEQPSINQDEAFIEINVHIKPSSNANELPNYVKVRYSLGGMLQSLVPIGKIYELSSDPNVSMISSIERPQTFGFQTSTGIKDDRIVSPKQQLKNGITPEDIICKEGLELIYKSKDNSPACVTPTTAEKLIERGWGKIQKTIYKEKQSLQIPPILLYSSKLNDKTSSSAPSPLDVLDQEIELSHVPKLGETATITMTFSLKPEYANVTDIVWKPTGKISLEEGFEFVNMDVSSPSFTSANNLLTYTKSTEVTADNPLVIEAQIRPIQTGNWTLYCDGDTINDYHEFYFIVTENDTVLGDKPIRPIETGTQLEGGYTISKVDPQTGEEIIIRNVTTP